MSWFAELAGKAEDLLNNFDEQAGVALRNHNVTKKKNDRPDVYSEPLATTQKKRPIPRNWKKPGQRSPTSPSSSPSRKISEYNTSSIRDPNDIIKQTPPKPKKKKPLCLNNEPKTLVSDIKDSTSVIIEHPCPNKERRFSMPSSLEIKSKVEKKKGNQENLGLENIMLKNELTFLNREMTDLVTRLRETEEGEDVIIDIEEELIKSKKEFGFYEHHKAELNNEKQSLINNVDDLKKELHHFKINEQKRFCEKTHHLSLDVSSLTEKNKGLEDSLKQLEEQLLEKKSNQIRLETELRYALIKVSELQSDLDKSTSECEHLKKDWETYKHRVKSMLLAKDKEIKSLNEGQCNNLDTKLLLDQIEDLKNERSALSETIANLRGDTEDMKQYIESMETRHNAAERVVGALRDAVKEERFARNRAEAQCGAATKELKLIQMETGQTIASLRIALREKESELNRLRESMTLLTPRSVSSDSSALNVADYDCSKESQTLHFLSQKLVQRQSKIDELLADNNTLKIQLAKAQSKSKEDALKQKADSVVEFNEERNRSKLANKDSSGVAKLSVRMGLLIRKNPLFRILILFYMMGLHVWVMTVLFASAPENIAIKPNGK